MLGRTGADSGDPVTGFMDNVYAWCAIAYKWKPDEVDEIPFAQLVRIMEINTGWIRDIVDGMSRSIPKI